MLSPKWVFAAQAHVSATPAVASDAIYFPDWAGNLFAVSRNDGSLIWSHKISDYDNYAGSLSRATPAI
jgi:polyvinyl alcohol dehydrogenase (cytochrome)